MKNKKKILISSYNLSIGGIETALISLIKYLKDKYDITLVLESKKGEFLSDVPDEVKILTYTPSNDKFFVFRKIKNLVKRLMFILKNKNKYDVSISFATYSKACSFCARTASKNSILWVHNDYTYLYDDENFMNFFDGVKFKEFSKRIFVSRTAKENFEKKISEKFNLKNNYFLNNYINEDRISRKLSDEDLKEIELIKEDKKYKFLNIGRHDQKQKNLTFLIDCVEMLAKKRNDFVLYMIGSGPDTNMYKDMVKSKNLSKYIKFLGVKKNVFPYYENSDCVVLCSNYEGYPVVFVESMIMNKPILTTDVSDAIFDIDKKFGDVVKKDIFEYSSMMEKYIINNKRSNNEVFNINDFNEKIQKKMIEIFNI